MRWTSPTIIQCHSQNAVDLIAHTNIHQTQLTVSTTKSAWKDHVRGLKAVVKNYGTAIFHQEPMRRALEQARMHIVYYCLLLPSWSR